MWCYCFCKIVKGTSYCKKSAETFSLSESKKTRKSDENKSYYLVLRQIITVHLILPKKSKIVLHFRVTMRIIVYIVMLISGNFRGFFSFWLYFRIERALQIWLFVVYFISLFNLLSFVNDNITSIAKLWKNSYEM